MRAVASSPGGYFPDNGLYGEAPPERATFLRLQVYIWKDSYLTTGLGNL